MLLNDIKPVAAQLTHNSQLEKKFKSDDLNKCDYKTKKNKKFV